MKHFYSEQQKISTNNILAEYERSTNVKKVDVLGSVYMPLVVFIRATVLDVSNDGNGGYTTDYVAIEYDGRIIRDASRTMKFDNAKQRMLIFSELILVNKP